MHNHQIVNPKTGQPFDQGGLTDDIDYEKITGVRPLHESSVAELLEPARLSSLIRDTNRGDTSAMLTLAEEMEERETHYAAVLGIRKRAVVRLPIIVEAASESPEHELHAAAVRWLIGRRCFRLALPDVLDALGKGFSVVEMAWQTDAVIPGKKGPAWAPQCYDWVDPRHFAWHERQLKLRLKHAHGDDKYRPIDERRYLIHKPKLKSGNVPERGSLARLAAATYMCKSYTLRDWVAFAEIFGIPIRLGKHNTTDPDSINALLNAVVGIGHEAAGVIHKSMDIEIVQGATASGTDLFDKLARYLDEQLSKAVLGQTMTTDNGSSYSQATVHNEVRLDVRDFDAIQLEETLNHQLIIQFIAFNYGPQSDYPDIRFDTDEPEDKKLFSDAAAPLITAGVKIRQNEARNRLGLDDIDGDEGDAYIASASEPPAPPRTATNSSALGNAIATAMLEKATAQLNASELAVESLTKQGFANWLEQLQPMIQPIVDRVNDIADGPGTEEQKQQALLDSMEDILEAMDETVLVQTLATHMLIARGEGNVRD